VVTSALGSRLARHWVYTAGIISGELILREGKQEEQTIDRICHGWMRRVHERGCPLRGRRKRFTVTGKKASRWKAGVSVTTGGRVSCRGFTLGVLARGDDATEKGLRVQGTLIETSGRRSRSTFNPWAGQMSAGFKSSRYNQALVNNRQGRSSTESFLRCTYSQMFGHVVVLPGPTTYLKWDFTWSGHLPLLVL
jgi:hypothetical protein